MTEISNTDHLWRQSVNGAWEWRSPDGAWHPYQPGPGEEIPRLVSPIAVDPNSLVRVYADGRRQHLAGDGYWYFGPPSPGWVTASTRGPSTQRARVAAWLAVAGGALAGLGALLPWLTANVFSQAVNRDAFQLGTHDHLTYQGPLILVAALVGVFIGVMCLARVHLGRIVRRFCFLAGLFVAITLINEYGPLHQLVTRVSSEGVPISISYGYWLTAAGAVLMVVAGFTLSLAQSMSQRLW